MEEKKPGELYTRILIPAVIVAFVLYLIFSVIVMHSSFNLFYMIGFMALGMIASLICAVIEYFVMKKRQSRQYALLTVGGGTARDYRPGDLSGIFRSAPGSPSALDKPTPPVLSGRFLVSSLPVRPS